MRFVDYDLIFLPVSASAVENWAEITGQLGSIVALQNQSQQNVVVDFHGHPVYLPCSGLRISFTPR